ncbi:winged helix DNA-binding domain-containing protein [Paractinoplanes rishiriensis]|uniref:winged helix DNA-binding domain-containing protein n=1 Tax=Paractinoplanes rishiriensis TaxID=1050105 RepID=UPI001EF1A1CF|nr:winged helix DNA-binding domain-containing protein [Actinoplanes rishiriensis]
MRHVSDDERRARLAVRHALAVPAPTPAAATTAMTVLHATEPATVYLSCWARVAGFRPADLDRALYTDRALVKQLAMRRTLFVFPRDLLPAVWPSASARSAALERAHALRCDPDWLDVARAAVLAALAGGGRTTPEIRRAAPLLDKPPTDMWPAYRVLNNLGLTADIVRGENTGGWHTARPRWTLMQHWLGTVPPSLTPDEGYREIVRRWLHTFGPGTEEDIVWWLGSTKAAVRAALATLAAEPVSLDGGETGWLLPDDLDPVRSPPPWAALLPVLDPTVMGWKGRDFYLGPHRAQLFDTRGNAGTTAWVDGRVVGCWVQNPSGVVQLRLLEPVSGPESRALATEAARLTEWLDGFRVGAVYRSPAMS